MNRKICFVSLGSYPLFTSNRDLKYVGGAELKQVLTGSELAKKGYNISFITYNEGGEKKKDFGRITIVKSFSPNKNFTLFTKARMLWNSLKKVNSDIYIQSGGTPGSIAFYCFVHRKKYIKWLSSDKNVMLEGIEDKTKLHTKIAMYLDIKLANLIIAQNKFQKDIIEKKFKKKCILIRNPIVISNKIIDFRKKKDNNIILWVSTIRAIKQPELFLKIAKMLPEHKFKMIGGESSSELELYDKIKKEVKYIPNLEFLGFVPYPKMKKHYEESSIFVNTSKAEGFPNTFLEAWLNYTPVVSLNVDPDEVICINKLGFHSKSFGQMIEDIRTLLTNQELYKEYGKNGRKYIEKNHNLKTMIIQYENLIKSV